MASCTEVLVAAEVPPMVAEEVRYAARAAVRLPITFARGGVTDCMQFCTEAVPRESPSSPSTPQSSPTKRRKEDADATPSTCYSDSTPRSFGDESPGPRSPSSSDFSGSESPAQLLDQKDAAVVTCGICSPKQLRTCRFCLDCEEVPFEEDVDTSAGECTDAFVSPCPCRGSTKYVHLDCLVQHFVAQGSWHNFKCPTCKQPYEGRALRKLAEVSRDRMMKDYGPQAFQVAHSLCFLAQAHTQLGNVLQSKEILERSLEISTTHFGAGHVATAATLVELATVCGKLGDVKRQKQLLETSLQIKEKSFGPGHISTAVTLNNLATVYSELGDIQQEKVLLERSVEIKEKHYGKGHVQTVAALVNLAGVYSELGDVAKGRELLEWSLVIEERHFGEGHVETAITLNNLALACGESGNVQRMQELLARCLAIKEQHFGSQHSELCLTLANLGMACAARGEDTAARRCCERALQACAEQRHGRRYGVVLLRTATVYAALLEASVPLQLAQEAAEVLQDALGASGRAHVVQLEGSRVGRIWAAMGREDISCHLRGLLDSLGASAAGADEGSDEGSIP